MREHTHRSVRCDRVSPLLNERTGTPGELEHQRRDTDRHETGIKRDVMQVVLLHPILPLISRHK